MRRILSMCLCAAFIACAGAGDDAESEAALSAADLAGQWSVDFMMEGSDSVVITTMVNATSTTEGWTITLPGRDPMGVHVVLGGDSVIMHAGPFESALRPGVMVRTESVGRLVNGMLEGYAVARYATNQPDSVVRLRSMGRRTP